MPTVEMTVNGKRASAQVEGRTLLVQFLREKLGLTGTHIGCDTSQCGACVVHVDGRAVKSCTMLAVQAAGATVTLTSEPTQGDIDLVLYDADGTTERARSATASNTEQVIAVASQNGVMLVRAFGASGATQNYYDLRVQVQ